LQERDVALDEANDKSLKRSHSQVEASFERRVQQLTDARLSFQLNGAPAPADVHGLMEDQVRRELLQKLQERDAADTSPSGQRT
jgi:hypothetical protein